MKKPTIKRFGLGLLQQLAAMLIMVSIAGILFNSYLAVESMNGVQTYDLSPMDTEPEFEDTEVFREIFSTAVSDITRLVVIKGQVETNEEFDAEKQIDVTQYANRTGRGNDATVTAVYQLEDLIKWGKYGVEYTNRPMSLSDFVNYFGQATSSANFALDEQGQLYFAGFRDASFVPKINREQGTAVSAEDGTAAENGVYDEERYLVEYAMSMYTEEQLEDMALSYIMTAIPEEISVSREDDGTMTVYFPMLSCRYDTVDGERQITSYVANWVDYAKLQRNVADAVTSLATAYEQYQNCYHLYLEDKSNLKYVVRMMTEEGITKTYTNVSALQDKQDVEITDFFAEYRRYLIYYPDSLEFTSNINITEEEISQFLNEYEYAYPETTHIWVGVDTEYPIVGDAFYNANMVFQRIVPNIGYIITICVLLGIIWLALGVYLTINAGVALDAEGQKVLYLNKIDRIWTEVMALAAVGLLFGAVKGYRYLNGIADLVYKNHSEILGETTSRLYQYGSFAAYGFFLSLFVNIIWYSIVRRAKSGVLWKGSFIYWILDGCRRGVVFVFTHRNTAVNTLLPYNLFVLANLVGILLAYILSNRGLWGLLCLLAIVVMDSIVGILIFKNRAEQIDIVEGIKRIRNGEVDYKLEVESLHGDNREMADAVNNIGEGIRKAVNTSMKDEQMKTDLITNVSHDIKTPLTSIINYVDLLKRLKIEDEPVKSYIAILDNKSQRLKLLTDDLVEASKISSGNIELQCEQLNLTELLNQAIGEFLDKFEEKNLHVVFEGNAVATNVYADSRRMWRVMENLFNNVCKYAMEGTRVYVDMAVKDGFIEMSIKNISQQQMNIHADELTERFIRGDVSRTTEGSGLGLYIAQSLTQAQGGEFIIHLDGDLFKVTLRFPEYVSGMEAVDEEGDRGNGAIEEEAVAQISQK